MACHPPAEHLEASPEYLPAFQLLDRADDIIHELHRILTQPPPPPPPFIPPQASHPQTFFPPPFFSPFHTTPIPGYSPIFRLHLVPNVPLLNTPPIIKLPLVKLPTFVGDITKFSKFMSAVTSLLDPQNIPSEVKLPHLEAALVGPPACLLENLPTNQHTYKNAKERLNKRYNQQEQIVAALYEKIRPMPKATDENTTSLRSTIVELENLMQALELHGEALNQNQYLKTIVFSKFPTNLIYLLTAATGKMDPLQFRPNMENLIAERGNVSITTALEPLPPDEAPKMTTAALITNINTSQKSSPRTDKQDDQHIPLSNSNRRSMNPLKPHCAFCQQPHWSDKCATYSTVQSRKARVPNSCYNCLRDDGHSQKECRSKKSCHYCSAVKRHHSALCPKQFGFPETKTADTNQEPKKTEQDPKS